jgi:hypothetical protein
VGRLTALVFALATLAFGAAHAQLDGSLNRFEFKHSGKCLGFPSYGSASASRARAAPIPGESAGGV